MLQMSLFPIIAVFPEVGEIRMQIGIKRISIGVLQLVSGV